MLRIALCFVSMLCLCVPADACELFSGRLFSGNGLFGRRAGGNGCGGGAATVSMTYSSSVSQAPVVPQVQVDPAPVAPADEEFKLKSEVRTESSRTVRVYGSPPVIVSQQPVIRRSAPPRTSLRLRVRQN